MTGIFNMVMDANEPRLAATSFAPSKPGYPPEDHTFSKIVLEAKEPVLVLFHAQWSKASAATFKALGTVAAERQQNLAIEIVDTDTCPLTCDSCKVTAVPTLVLFSGGREIVRHAGSLPTAPELATWLEYALPFVARQAQHAEAELEQVIGAIDPLPTAPAPLTEPISPAIPAALITDPPAEPARSLSVMIAAPADYADVTQVLAGISIICTTWGNIRRVIHANVPATRDLGHALSVEDVGFIGPSTEQWFEDRCAHSGRTSVPMPVAAGLPLRQFARPDVYMMQYCPPDVVLVIADPETHAVAALAAAMHVPVVTIPAVPVDEPAVPKSAYEQFNPADYEVKV